MNNVVLLDAGPLGMYANPKSRKPKNKLCKQRVEALLAGGAYVKVPEIADYEVRRKLIHLTLRDPKCKAILRLDAVIKALGLVPFTADTLKRAAKLWAEARHRNHVTAPPEAIDGDVILATQAIIETEKGDNVEIATTNSTDLAGLFPKLLNWDDLKQP
jgi:hypothetical protein